eukprot:gene4521-4959_t
MAVLYKTPSILDEEDIFQSILLDWLILKDLLNLDLALNRQYRLQLHTFFQSQSFKMIQPFQDKEHRNLWGKRGNLWRTHGEAIFQWMALRKVYHSQGQWEVDCWEVLSTAPSEENKNMNYRPILENMIDMRLSTLPTNFDLSQLSLCKELRRLRLRGLHAKHVSLSCQTHICPKLQSLTLERCDVSMTVIDAFAHCYDLLDMKLEYNKYMEKEKEQDLSEYTIALLARLQSLSFFGDVNELVDKFFPKGIVLSLSKLVLEGDSRTASILDLVTRCPHVRELELYSVDFSFPVALKAIRENMPQLSRLLVNGCIWTERIEDSVASAADLVNPGQQLYMLEFKSNITSANPDLDTVLKFCGQFVRELKLHFGWTFLPTVYQSINSHCPYLTTFSLLYRTVEPGDLPQDHMNEIQRVLCSQPQIRVVLINIWRDKNFRTHETVFFDSANH